MHVYSTHDADMHVYVVPPGSLPHGTRSYIHIYTCIHAQDPFLMAYVNLKLAAAGLSMAKMRNKEENFMRLVEPILKTYRELHNHAYAPPLSCGLML
jgi:hypothetical protein